MGCVADTAEALDPLSLWGQRRRPVRPRSRSALKTLGTAHHQVRREVGREHER